MVCWWLLVILERCVDCCVLWLFLRVVCAGCDCVLPLLVICCCLLVCRCVRCVSVVVEWSSSVVVC